MKQYVAPGKTIFTLNPDFENIEYLPLTYENEEEPINEGYHTADLNDEIRKTYEKIKEETLKIDPEIRLNPQKYYISLRKKRNFAFIKFQKKRIRIIIMLPYQKTSEIIKKHSIKKLSEVVQSFYNGPSTEIFIENQNNLEEIITALSEAYKNQNK
jgi:predicted transport protein